MAVKKKACVRIDNISNSEKGEKGGKRHPPPSRAARGWAQTAGRARRPPGRTPSQPPAPRCTEAQCPLEYLLGGGAGGSGPKSFFDDGPTSRLVRQILGAVSEFDKAMTVAKLKGAREQKRNVRGWCEGGQPLEQRYPAAIAAQRSFTENIIKQENVAAYGKSVPRSRIKVISAKYGGVDAARPFNAATVRAMLAQPKTLSLAPQFLEPLHIVLSF